MTKTIILAIQIVCVLLIFFALTTCACGCWKSPIHKCGCCQSAGDCCSTSERFIPSSVIPVNTHRMVTLYYADWCPACQLMKPVWEQVKVATQGSGIEYREIDNDQEKSAGITGLPTIRMIDENGKTYDYAGGPNYAQLRNWIVSPLIQGNR